MLTLTKLVDKTIDYNTIDIYYGNTFLLSINDFDYILYSFFYKPVKHYYTSDGLCPISVQNFLWSFRCWPNSCPRKSLVSASDITGRANNNIEICSLFKLFHFDENLYVLFKIMEVVAQFFPPLIRRSTLCYRGRHSCTFTQVGRHSFHERDTMLRPLVGSQGCKLHLPNGRSTLCYCNDLAMRLALGQSIMQHHARSLVTTSLATGVINDGDVQISHQ